MCVFGLVRGVRLLWPNFRWFRFGSAEVQLVGGLLLFDSAVVHGVFTVLQIHVQLGVA